MSCGLVHVGPKVHFRGKLVGTRPRSIGLISLSTLFLGLDALYAICVYFQAEDGIRDYKVTGVQTCALPILGPRRRRPGPAGQDPLPPGVRRALPRMRQELERGAPRARGGARRPPLGGPRGPA